MNKSLIILPFLALLAVGIIYSVSQNQDESSDLEYSAPTISQWESCRNNSQIYAAAQAANLANSYFEKYACYTHFQSIPNFSDFSAVYYPCLDAAQNTYQLFQNYYGESDNCQTFHNFYWHNDSQEILPASYYACLQDCLKYAKSSDYYYNNIFIPLYQNCAQPQ